MDAIKHMNTSTNEEKKITLHVMIEGGRTFTESFVIKQKLQVVINKALEYFNLPDAANRQLIRGDESKLNDHKLTIEEAGLRDDETIRFTLMAAPKPDEPKKFA